MKNNRIKLAPIVSLASMVSLGLLTGVTIFASSVQNKDVLKSFEEPSNVGSVQTLSFNQDLFDEQGFENIRTYTFKDAESSVFDIAVAKETIKNNKSLKTYVTSWVEGTVSLAYLFYTDEDKLDLQTYYDYSNGVYSGAVRYNTVVGDYNIPVVEIVQLTPLDEEHFISVHITNANVDSYDAPVAINQLSELLKAYNIAFSANDLLSLEKSQGNSTLFSDSQLLSAEYTDSRYFTFDSATGTITEYRSQDAGAPTVVVIPPTLEGVAVKAIGDKAFYKYSRATEITAISLPDSITYIGEEAFAANDRLETIKMPSSLVTLGEGAFENCVSLKTIEILGNVYEIPRSCFHNCESLDEVRLPESVTTIGDTAFSECRVLMNMNRPASLKAVGKDAFKNCKYLDTTLFEIEEK